VGLPRRAEVPAVGQRSGRLPKSARKRCWPRSGSVRKGPPLVGRPRPGTLPRALLDGGRLGNSFGPGRPCGSSPSSTIASTFSTFVYEKAYCAAIWMVKHSQRVCRAAKARLCPDSNDSRSVLRMLRCFMEHQTTVATILEFPAVAETWIPRHARQCTADDIEFHSLRLLQRLADASCKPVTLWPSHNYGARWAGPESWVTYGDGRARELPANAAKGSTPLMTLLPRHYHARIVRHYHAS
jgi:hypothetical protein